MPYFDFHVHPTLKCMFSEANAKTSPWVDIDVKKISERGNLPRNGYLGIAKGRLLVVRDKFDRADSTGIAR